MPFFHTLRPQWTARCSAGVLAAAVTMIVTSPVSAAQIAETGAAETTAKDDAAAAPPNQQKPEQEPENPQAEPPAAEIPGNPKTDPAAPAKEIAVQPILQTAVAAKRYAFVAAVKAAGLVDQFGTSEPITVLIPTDAAFAKLPKGKLQELLEPANRPALIDLVNNHIFKGPWTAEKIKSLDSLSNLHGNEIPISIDDDDQQISVGTARVIEPDIQCSNGRIHTIDAVLWPPMLSSPE